MRYVTLGAVVWCLMGAPASAQAQDAQPMATIKKFIDSFNKGDMAGAPRRTPQARISQSPTRCRPSSGPGRRP